MQKYDNEEKKKQISFLRKELEKEKTKQAIMHCKTLKEQINHYKKKQNEQNDKVQKLIEEIDEMRR